jgi:hypothetical protein
MRALVVLTAASGASAIESLPAAVAARPVTVSVEGLYCQVIVRSLSQPEINDPALR